MVDVMRFFKGQAAERALYLHEIASTLRGQRLQAIWYYDATCEENGETFFEADIPERQKFIDIHHLMFGIDIVTDQRRALAFRWDTYRKPGEYELDLIAGSLEANLPKAGGWKRLAQSSHPCWVPLVGQTIRNFVFTRDVQDDHRHGFICDCRIDFEDAQPVWICARSSGNGFQDTGDDIIAIFDRETAVNLGVRVDAS